MGDHGIFPPALAIAPRLHGCCQATPCPSPFVGSDDAAYWQTMRQPSFDRHRFNWDTILPAVCLYYRFALSLRDVEEVLAERGIDLSPPSQPTSAMLDRTAIAGGTWTK